MLLEQHTDALWGRSRNRLREETHYSMLSDNYHASDNGSHLRHLTETLREAGRITLVMEMIMVQWSKRGIVVEERGGGLGKLRGRRSGGGRGVEGGGEGMRDIRTDTDGWIEAECDV